MASKSIFESKSIWFNVLSIVAMSITALLVDPTFKEEYGGSTLMLVVAVNVINMILRFYTVKPLSVAVKKPKIRSNLDILETKDI